jgi:2-hydroxy-3-keto-5-methylthiopentenyl-1-phosphate phosphatase
MKMSLEKENFMQDKKIVVDKLQDTRNSCVDNKIIFPGDVDVSFECTIVPATCFGGQKLLNECETQLDTSR